ncbi:MAG: putative MAPEG superfamily protein, partial [Myxococcota bacterium]
MSPSILALLLVVAIIGWRSVLVLREDVSPFAMRLSRAHANCVENLPVFAAIVVVAGFAERFAVTDPLAPVLLAARVGQSVVHLASTSYWAVMVRFGLFVVQVGIGVWWG